MIVTFTLFLFSPNGTPPVFERVFSNARFAQGGDALFEGRVTGDPKPVISWTRKGAPLMGKFLAETSELPISNQMKTIDNPAGHQFGQTFCQTYDFD